MTYQPHNLAPSLADRPPSALPRRTTEPTGRPPAAPRATANRPPVPHTAELAERYQLIQHLDLPTGADEVFDDFARSMTEATGFLYGFVNLFLEQQTFIGLHQPPPDSGFVIVGRTMSLDHGWCPEVVARKKALPLPDVHASPRFSGNHVVDAVGIRSYFGAPLIHSSGTTLGTVCVIDPEKRSLADARRLRDIVIDTGSQVMRHITRARPL
ncbi:GAF domain-containing protein [Streptomyces sp. ISL-12]|uniref:GAF domain-containing protein n=1 Tax=Streptomyces sp. ISL-12 TaxID=2819177 RepID=UPI001BEA174B|nr:GAF domain-containing protein [Streptomyces sp. ISL-12]MBT2412065.1 GAF domain-containing protein [Streptomyces sp. ISL-12]